MAMEVIGLLIVLSHGLVIGSLILWFGLGKPTTWPKFCAQFKKHFFGISSAPR